ncbi:hypothetical protein AAG906_016444 [Vitis piasezkii]
MVDKFSSSLINPVVLTTRNNLSSQPNTLISINAFTNLLFRYDLLGFLDGTTPCSPETILQSSSTTPISNPECKLWKR